MTIRSFRKLLASAVLSSLLLTACGSGRNLAPDFELEGSSSLPDDVEEEDSSNSALAEAIPQILKGIEDIKQEIKALEITRPAGSSSTGSSKPSTSKPSTGGTTKPSTGGTTSKPSTSTPKPSTPAPAAENKGPAELKAIINKIATAPFVVLTAEKTEKNLDSGKVSFNKIKMSSKQPNVVKIDILKSSSGSEGVSALYTSGVGNTIKIKKLFIKLDLSKTDDRVVSNNGYTGDVIDLFGVSKRLGNGYDAELVGTTQLNGKTINVLKLSTTGTNTLDSRIGYEYIGYEPDTHAIRLWELYDKSGGKDPFYRMVLTDISFPASLPDSTFNL